MLHKKFLEFRGKLNKNTKKEGVPFKKVHQDIIFLLHPIYTNTGLINLRLKL